MPQHPSLNLTRLRKAAGAAAIDGFFRGLSGVGRWHPNASPARHGVEVLPDIAYLDTGLAQHRLDIWRPRAPTGPSPALLYIHGGGFRILSKETHWVMGLGFARRGFTVFSINYRLAPQFPFPAALQDAAAAYQWVVQHAGEYGADLSELVIAGESAGANLATATTLAACFERPEPWAQAVFATGVVPKVMLPACGMLQVSDAERFRRRKPHKIGPFLQDRLDEVSHSYLHRLSDLPESHRGLADPLVVLEGAAQPLRPLPPCFAGVGTADLLLDDTRRLHTALTKRGVVSEARYYPKQVHAFQAMVFLPQARQYWQDQFAFLEAQLGRSLPTHRGG